MSTSPSLPLDTVTESPSCRNKHSSFSTAFPIFLQTHHVKMVPREEPQVDDETEEKEPEAPAETPKDDVDEEEAVVEEVTEESEEKAKEPELVPMTYDEWEHLNSQPPLWMRYVPVDRLTSRDK